MATISFFSFYSPRPFYIFAFLYNSFYEFHAPSFSSLSFRFFFPCFYLSFFFPLFISRSFFSYSLYLFYLFLSHLNSPFFLYHSFISFPARFLLPLIISFSFASSLCLFLPLSHFLLLRYLTSNIFSFCVGSILILECLQ